MDIEAGFKLITDGLEDVKTTTEDIRRANAKPIHRPVIGAIQNSTGSVIAGPVQLWTNDTVDAGRVWYIERISLFGNDGHTALTTPAAAITQPPVPASGTAQANYNNFPVNVTVTGGTVTVIAVNGNATGLTSGTVTVPAGGSITLTYSVAPTWTWVNASGGSPTLVDVYSGAPGLALPDFSAEIYPGLTIPSTNYPIEEAEVLHYGEGIVGLVYNIPANSQVAMICKIADYPVEAVESLVV